MVMFEECGPPLQASDLAEFEKRHKVKFPAEYREFLLNQNGGVPTPDTFSFESGTEGSCVRCFHRIRGGGTANRLDFVLEVFAGRVPNELLPIASDPFGNLICLGKEGTNFDKRVVFWDHELEADDDEPMTYENLIPIASSLEEFLAGLHPTPYE